MPDHEVREIQLNGKQLVFTFMAATVVAVVIFLSGVMVGRGVRLPEADVLIAGADPVVDPAASPDTALSGTALTTDPAPAPAPDSLGYAENLEAAVAPNEPLKPAESRQPEPKPVVAPAASDKAASSKVAAPRETKEANKNFAEPPGNGWVAQVQTFGSLSDAEALAGRLKAQGYRTFVALNESGLPGARYRVRIGKYPTRGEAVAVGEKLQREERFKPWVTR